MSRIALTAALACLLAALSACDQYGAAIGDDVPDARARVVHLAADTPALDLLLDGATLHSGISFPSASSYTAVLSRRSSAFEVRNSAGTTLATRTFIPAGGQDYSILIFGGASALRMFELLDASQPATSGNFGLRFVHVAPQLGVVDLYVTDPDDEDLTDVVPLLSLDFEFATNYFGAAAGSYRLRGTNQGTKTVVFDSGSRTFTSTSMYTFYFVETEGGGEPYDVLLLTDRN